jgi:hypothetical protein
MERLKVSHLSGHDTSNSIAANVFSIANGQLYERLLKIMMLAVPCQSAFSVKF